MLMELAMCCDLAQRSSWGGIRNLDATRNAITSEFPRAVRPRISTARKRCARVVRHEVLRRAKGSRGISRTLFEHRACLVRGSQGTV